MIDVAADAGVDAVKFQTFRADRHYSKYAPGFSYLNNCNPYEPIKSLELDRAWHVPLKKHCESRNVAFFSSPCDVEAIDELDALGIQAFKVASFDLIDLGLIRHMARKGRPVILSTGLADTAEIQRAVEAARQEGNHEIVLLQCTALYPAPAHLANLRAMRVMRETFGLLTGYSDHTEGDHVCLASVALSACIVEKHLTLDRTMAGLDHAFAIEPGELTLMMRRLREVEAGMGDGAKTAPRPEEHEMFEKGRRSLHDIGAADASVAMLKTVADNARCPIVLALSMTVYGAAPDCPVDEGSGKLPAPGYARGKWTAKQLPFDRHRIDDVALRLPGLFGLPRRSGLLYNAAKAFLTHGRFEFAAPAEPWAAMVVDDAAEYLVRTAITPSGQAAQAVNVGYEGELSVVSAVAQIASACGVEWCPPLTTVQPFSMRLQRLESRYGPLAGTFQQRLDEFVDAVRHDEFV
ncbi:MAG: hypothetical protein EXQ55_02985 [Acidobacteria bacterium]|nr:hypothetical protein [Acidobacteriota bacterium]